jgi:hypothetical protein
MFALTLTEDFQAPYWRHNVRKWEHKVDTSKDKQRLELKAFAWTYAQKTGELQQNGEHIATGYSGAGPGKNNPEMENVHNLGPIPRGDWAIVGPPINTAEHGPFVLRLDPAANTQTFERNGFLMHGDSIESPGRASQGCVIMPRSVREQVWKSGDRDLKVVAEIPVPASQVDDK